MSGCAALISVFIREPEFQGQNKGRLQTVEAARIVEGVLRDAFDHWLGQAPTQASKLLDFAISRADERLRRRAEKDVARKTATAKAAAAGKLATARIPRAGLRAVHRRGRFGGRVGQAGA